MLLFPKLKTKLVLFIVLFASLSLILALVSADNQSGDLKEGRILITEPSQTGSFFIAADIEQNQIVSPVLQAEFRFNSLFAEWLNDANSPAEFNLFVRFLNENWSDWHTVNLDDDYQGKDIAEAKLTSQLISTKLTDTFQYKLVFTSKTVRDNLKNLQFVYLDTTNGPQGNFKIASQTNDNGLTIITRAEWGANETYRYDEAGNDLWEEEYYTPQKFVLHHTAGENTEADPKAALRAIQYWHAVGRGWGDIGYNYLIDSKGNVYEGRAGGDGVVGGHAYLRNRNTIGIALLGCYQEDNSVCNKPDQLTEAAKTSLNILIASKSREFNIDPLGQSDFHGQVLSNIVGHSDVGSTLCPGNLLKNQLPATRQLAYNLLQDLGGYKPALATAAQYISQSSKTIDVEETKTAEVMVEFKNTGQAIWRGYEDAGLFLADSNVKKTLAQVGSVQIALDKNYAIDQQLIKYKLVEGNVYPGELGHFQITLSAPKEKTTTKNFTLVWDKRGYFPDSDFSLTINKIACNSCQTEVPGLPTQPTNQPNPLYSVKLENSSFPSQIPAEQSSQVVMQFVNIGNQVLNQDQLKLKITYQQDQISPFRNNSWYSEFAQILPSQTSIAPGAIATFEFNLQAPAVAAEFPHTISLNYNGQVLFTTDQAILVTSPYAATITSNTIPVAVKTSWRPKVKITFTNTGSATWTKPTLKSYDLDYTNSWFRDWSWVDNKTVGKKSQTVTPGESITFEFKITPYWKPGTYPQVYKLFDGNKEIYLNGKKDFVMHTRIDR